MERKKVKLWEENGVLFIKLLGYERGEIFFWDPYAFRPDILEGIKENVRESYIIFEEENLYNGDVVFIPRIIIIENSLEGEEKYINVRH